MSAGLCGLTGAHGTGKTTLLHELQALGVPVSAHQLARAAQAKLGWASLAPARTSLTAALELQAATFEALLARDKALAHELASRRQPAEADLGWAVVVDRTPADLWAYTALWLRHHGCDPAADPSAVAYRGQLERHALAHYRAFLYVPVRAEVRFAAEAARAAAAEQAAVAEAILGFLAGCQAPVHHVTALAPSARAAEVAAYLRALGPTATEVATP